MTGHSAWRDLGLCQFVDVKKPCGVRLILDFQIHALTGTLQEGIIRCFQGLTNAAGSALRFDQQQWKGDVLQLIQP